MCHICLQANASKNVALANSPTTEIDCRPAAADAAVSCNYICACQNCYCHGYSTKQLVLISSVVAAERVRAATARTRVHV